MLEITFQLNYNTQWGERIAVIGSCPELGEWKAESAFPLSYQAGGNWTGTLQLNSSQLNISYKYVLVREQNLELEESGEARSVKGKFADSSRISVKDAWRAPQHPENAMYNAAFSEAIYKPGKHAASKGYARSKKGGLSFHIAMPRLLPHQQLCLTGNAPELGNWDPQKVILMGNAQPPVWKAFINSPVQPRIEYKYGIYDTTTKNVIQLESGPNRELDAVFFHGYDQTMISDAYFAHPNGNWKGSGMAIPVFALRTQNSFGVGAFSDIKLLVDWALETGMSLVQILPVNDTSATGTWVDSYPYGAISVFALHPLYLDLEAIPGFKKQVDQKEYGKLKAELNKLEQVDYEAVMKWKLLHSRAIFDKEKANFKKDKAFKQFLNENQHWLKPYAYFCHLRDTYKTVNFQEWGSDSIYDASKMKKATASTGPVGDEIHYYYFLQFHLDKQLRNAADYARSKRVVLKGDIPIGIYRYSVDAWTQPELYNMDGQSGAPPDPFSDLGQNWGFPTYNWAEMAKNGYKWWQNRLQQLSGYFDAFRIDHILGFFRIWQIPTDQVQGTMGFFNPAIPVRINEFAERGIPFNKVRFCEPYIEDWVLQEIFGVEAILIKTKFLQGEGPYSFKPALNTQKKIEAFLKQKKNAELLPLKSKLYELVSNLLFFEVEGSNGQEFHPRIDFQKTTSFKGLDQGTRWKLSELYNDYFYQRQDSFWKEQAMTKLPAIKEATNMLICGEDLGMIPDCVPEVMRKLELLTLEIQRMSKNPNTEFLQAADIPYLSVISPSTHDMSPLRLWWEESDIQQIRRFYNQELQMGGLAPETLEAHVAERILRMHLLWPGMWVIFPIQDLLSMDEKLRAEDPEKERINVPANPQHYWRYRLHLELEQLIKEKAFNERVRGILEGTGRKS